MHISLAPHFTDEDMGPEGSRGSLRATVRQGLALKPRTVTALPMALSNINISPASLLCCGLGGSE